MKKGDKRTLRKKLRDQMRDDQKCTRLTRFLTSFLLISTVLVCPVAAADLSPNYSSKVWEIYSIGRKISLPLAAISFAMGAFKMLGDEKSMAAGRKQLFITLLAVAALIILPSVVKLGLDIGQTYGWNPAP